jgi:hypothetical protein
MSSLGTLLLLLGAVAVLAFITKRFLIVHEGDSQDAAVSRKKSIASQVIAAGLILAAVGLIALMAYVFLLEP